jgi:hypothetical protein
MSERRIALCLLIVVVVIIVCAALSAPAGSRIPTGLLDWR